MSFAGCQINMINVNFHLQKVWKFLMKIQLTKSDPKRTRGWKVPSLMAIRVKGYNPQHYLLGSTNQAWLDSYSTKSWIISYLTPRWCNFALSKWSLDSDLLSSLSFAKLFGTSRVWVKKYTIKVKFQFNHVK